MITQIQNVAKNNGYKQIDHQENIKMVSFSKDNIRINVYYTKMTIATCIKHPKQGRTQLFRRGVWDIKLLDKIFKNPRIHTGMGYHRV